MSSGLFTFQQDCSPAVPLVLSSAQIGLGTPEFIGACKIWPPNSTTGERVGWTKCHWKGYPTVVPKVAGWRTTFRASAICRKLLNATNLIYLMLYEQRYNKTQLTQGLRATAVHVWRPYGRKL